MLDLLGIVSTVFGGNLLSGGTPGSLFSPVQTAIVSVPLRLVAIGGFRAAVGQGGLRSCGGLPESLLRYDVVLRAFQRGSSFWGGSVGMMFGGAA